MANSIPGPSINVQALSEKYHYEQAKRLRKDGIAQYQYINEGPLQSFLADPQIKSPPTREPVEETVEVLIVGGGFGGQLVGARLHAQGISNYKIIDKAADFGGTWYYNRYPGLVCDIESYIYFPLLEELGYFPTQKYATGSEILEFSRKIARHYGQYEKALLQTRVESLKWNGDSWLAVTDRGDSISARFVAIAGGVLHKPKLPGIRGIENFKGKSFHTSRWDWEYSGGTQDGGLGKLKDKKVAIIGTGASAVQIVPHLAESAQQLYVFQRTPSSVDVRDNPPTKAEWIEEMKKTPGWHEQRRVNFNTIVSGGQATEDLVSDGWTDILRNLSHGLSGLGHVPSMQEIQEKHQLCDYEKMEQIRKRVELEVKDPVVAEKLKPWYNQLCKRPCFHNEYLASFNRPNVTLVDTSENQGVQSVDQAGIVANNQHYEVDAIIYATGFEFGTDYCSQLSLTITGKDDVTLSEHWKNGMTSFHGFCTQGFPNLFVLSIRQSGFTPNVTHGLDIQAQHIAYILSEAKRRNVKTIEPTKEAEDEWTATIAQLAVYQQPFLKACTPGFYNREGETSAVGDRNASYGGGSPAFFALLNNWRVDGALKGLEFTQQA